METHGETLGEPSGLDEARLPVMIYLLSYEDLLADDSVAIPLGRTVAVGRSANGRVGLQDDGGIGIPDRWASGRHASLERRGEHHVVTDLGSRNGTRVNGALVSEHRLVDGDLLEVGHALFLYRRVPASWLDAVLAGQTRLGPTRTLSPVVLALATALDRIAPSPEPVIVLAETGAGKEVVAQAVHRLSGRSGPFRAVDCGAVPEDLFESTLFGHRRGAFTGALEHRVGEVQLSDGGTLFLDEVGNLSPASQAKLLRVIETHQVMAVGAQRPDAVDLRCVAATNRDLFDGEGFREDLLRRLAGFVAVVPPLRDRREDLGTLTAHVLRQAGAMKARITPAAARRLFGGSFPGNIRELRATLRTATLLAAGEPIGEDHLPAARSAPVVGSERERVVAALTEHGGNVSAAARALNTHARQLRRWIARYGIDLDAYRS